MRALETAPSTLHAGRLCACVVLALVASACSSRNGASGDAGGPPADAATVPLELDWFAFFGGPGATSVPVLEAPPVSRESVLRVAVTPSEEVWALANLHGASVGWVESGEELGEHGLLLRASPNGALVSRIPFVARDGYVRLHDMSLHADGGVVVCGATVGEMEVRDARLVVEDRFDTRQTDGFVARFDAEGELRWLVPERSGRRSAVVACVARPEGGIWIATNTVDGNSRIGDTSLEPRRCCGVGTGRLVLLDEEGAVRVVVPEIVAVDREDDFVLPRGSFRPANVALAPDGGALLVAGTDGDVDLAARPDLGTLAAPAILVRAGPEGTVAWMEVIDGTASAFSGAPVPSAALWLPGGGWLLSGGAFQEALRSGDLTLPEPAEAFVLEVDDAGAPLRLASLGARARPDGVLRFHLAGPGTVAVCGSFASRVPALGFGGGGAASVVVETSVDALFSSAPPSPFRAATLSRSRLHDCAPRPGGGWVLGGAQPSDVRAEWVGLETVVIRGRGLGLEDAFLVATR